MLQATGCVAFGGGFHVCVPVLFVQGRMLQPTGCVTVGGGFQVAGDRLCGYRWWVPSCKRGRPSLVGG